MIGQYFSRLAMSKNFEKDEARDLGRWSRTFTGQRWPFCRCRKARDEPASLCKLGNMFSPDV